MCGLFGFSHYGEEAIKNISVLTSSLAEESAARGIDATGISFCKDASITIQKDSKSAYAMKLDHPDNIKVVMGHTRHTTQGSEKFNFNNHPFGGRTKNTLFALAHNGILNNCKKLSVEYELPHTHIETDSFIAVQLIEKQKLLNFNSIRFMAEAVEGSFCFSILDTKNNLYLVKGDNPLSILHFPTEKIYVYASTEEILWKSLISSPLFDSLKKGDHKEVKIHTGDIMRIDPCGKIELESFRFKYPTLGFPYAFQYDDFYSDDTYISELKGVAGSMGYGPDFVDDMIGYGFTFDDIENYLYCRENF